MNAARREPHDLAKKIRKIKLLVLDVDGVLTGGEIVYGNRGHEYKIFNVKDGLGVYILSQLGIPTVLLSARNSPVLHARAKDMHVVEVIGNVKDKASKLSYLMNTYNVRASEICFIGDDLIDCGLIKAVGFGVAVKDAAGWVRKLAAYTTKAIGGKGAVREVVDLIIQYQRLSGRLRLLLKF